jgi:hypothetical protein
MLAPRLHPARWHRLDLPIKIEFGPLHSQLRQIGQR